MIEADEKKIYDFFTEFVAQIRKFRGICTKCG